MKGPRASYRFSHSYSKRDNSESCYKMLADSWLRPPIKGSIVSNMLVTTLAKQPLSAYALKLHNNLVHSRKGQSIRRILHQQYKCTITDELFQVIVYLYVANNEQTKGNVVAIYLTDKRPTSNQDSLYKLNVQHNVHEECRKYNAKKVNHIFIETETVEHDLKFLKTHGLHYLTHYLLFNDPEAIQNQIFVYSTGSIKIPCSSPINEFKPTIYVLQGSKWSDCVDLLVDDLILSAICLPKHEQTDDYSEPNDERIPSFAETSFGLGSLDQGKSPKRFISSSNRSAKRKNEASTSNGGHSTLGRNQQDDVRKKIIVLEDVWLPRFSTEPDGNTDQHLSDDEDFITMLCSTDWFSVSSELNQ